MKMNRFRPKDFHLEMHLSVHEALEYIVATLERAIEMNQKTNAPNVVIDTLADACGHAYSIYELLNDGTDIIHGLEGVSE
jgi:hypothetical protein